MGVRVEGLTMHGGWDDIVVMSLGRVKLWQQLVLNSLGVELALQ